VRTGALLDLLGAAFMLVFGARIYVLMRRAEGRNGWLSVLAAFGLLAGVVGSFVDKAPGGGLMCVTPVGSTPAD
jgi:hypothetical protein